MKIQCAHDIAKAAWGVAVASLLYGNVARADVLATAGAATVSTGEGPAVAVAPVDAAAAQFTESCAGCHTIGGGVSRGPDLAAVAAWPEPHLTQAVKSMERKVGPLSIQQVEGLVQMLKDGAVQTRIAAAKAKLSRASEHTSQPADSRLGGALFFGLAGLQNGGMACSSCHRYRGEGGELGPDLTRFAEGAQLEALAGTIARAGFNVMRSAYETHPITQQEARHIAAFMLQAKSQRIVAPLAATTVTGFGVGIGALLLTLALILTRPTGVRARLVQRATKR